MKKLSLIILAAVMLFAFACCSGGKTPTDSQNRADTSLREGEMKLSGKVNQVTGNLLLIEDEKGSKYVFDYSDETVVVEDGYYVVDLSADFFVGKRVTVIVSEQVQETYPAGLTGERMIIVE